MKLSIRRLATLAGLLGLATAAIAVDPDATIVISRSLNSPTFSVKYNGASVAMAELRVNGESITTRNLNASVTSGETDFSVNLSTFSDGENEVEVRLFDKSGKLVGSQKTLVNQDSSSKPAVFLSTPKVGATIQGPIEIKVGFGQKFKDSYVSFFIDNQFRTMSNVEPFTYVWDTARENNGWHELEAWVVNGGEESSDTLKSKKVRVFVDNPGGHTARRFASTAKTTPTAVTAKPSDLITIGAGATGMTIKGSPVKIVTTPATTSPVTTLLPLTLLATAIPAKTSVASGLKPYPSTPMAAAAATGLRHMTPTGKRLADRPIPAVASTKPTVVTAPRPAVAKPTKPVIDIKPSVKQDTAKPANNGQVAMPGAPVTGMSVSHIRPLSTTEDVKPVSVGVVTMAPTTKTTKTPIAPPHPVRTETTISPSMLAVSKPIKSTSKVPIVKTSSTVTTLVKIEPGVKLPMKGSFAIIMDGDIVEFDVQPRVESGVPMTPFRHLIEKKGGEVTWVAKTKEVNAKAAGQSIYLQIGTRIARIDQKSISLDLAPYIDGGRTIVPLSFIRETLKVNVDYDKATGHVLITSIK